MLHSSLLATTLVALVGMTGATPATSRRQVAVIDTYFDGSNFQEGCSPGGCQASFNLTSSGGSSGDGSSIALPAFDVVCHPIYAQQGFINCAPVAPLGDDETVASWWTDAGEREDIKLVFQHLWPVPGAEDKKYNASGSIEFPGDGSVTNFAAHITSLAVLDSTNSF